MTRRPFDHQDIQVSEVGLGCWQLGGSEWGNLDEKEAFSILHTAVDAGTDFFDTADVYGAGRSESLIGRFLKECRERIFVATKLGRTSELFPDKYTEQSVRAATEASLKRLGVESLDLTQLHCVPPEVLQQGEIFDWLRTLRQQGKIKSFGASVESMEEALLCLEQDGLASLQIIFNLFRQKPVSVLFPKATEKKVAIIVRLPLASGLLSGKMTTATTFGENDHRTFNRNGEKFNVGETFAGLPFELGVELAGELKRFVPPDQTLAELSQRWILDHDAVTTIIPGASRPEQAGRNAKVSSLPPLGENLHTQLRDFYEQKVARHIRGPY